MLGGGRWEAGHRPTTTLPDAPRWHPMRGDGDGPDTHHNTRPFTPVHPHQQPSAGGWRQGAGEGCGDVPNHPLRPPSRLSLYRGASEAIHHHQTDPHPTPISPSNRIGFFEIGGHTSRPGAGVWGMSEGGSGRGIATARQGGCYSHVNGQIRQQTKDIMYSTEI
jgi:hypothetical protein